MGSAGVLLIFASLIVGSQGRKAPPALFLYQHKSECHFLNGTQRVRFLDRYFYDRQEYVRFDSDLGKFVAVTEVGKPDADYSNNRTDYLREWRAGVDRFCRHNYGVMQGSHVVGRRTMPTVTISFTKTELSSPRTILLCTLTGFYPSEIKVQWLKNGQLQKEGVGYGEKLQNGDWTYQLQVMLETTPKRGDVYTCQVEHASLEDPITVQWEPRSSSSAKSKLWTGTMAFVLGGVFLAVGLSLYLKSKKATSVQQPAALMS